MDPLRLAAGLIPLGIYLLVMGCLDLRRRPTLMTSGQEALLIGFALSGFMWIGPIELFFPTGAYATLGYWAWGMLLLLYGLTVLLVSLQRAPAWTVLRLDCDQLRTVISGVLDAEGIEHSWLGNQLEVPRWSLRAIVESSRGFKGTSHLSPCGRQMNVLGWYELEKRVVASRVFSEAIRAGSGITTTRGFSILVLGLVCLIVSLFFIDQDMERLQRLIGRILGG